MDEDNNPDRLLSEPPEHPLEQHQRTSSIPPGAPPTGDDVSSLNGDAAPAPAAPVALPPVEVVDPNAKVVRDVVNSEVRGDPLVSNGGWELTGVLRSGCRPY